MNNNSILLSASFDGTCKVFQLGSLEYDPASAGDVGVVQLEELLKGFTEEKVRVVAKDKLLSSTQVYSDTGIFRMALNPTMPLMAASSKLNSLRLYSVESDICNPFLLKEFTSHNLVVNQVALLKVSDL